MSRTRTLLFASGAFLLLTTTAVAQNYVPLGRFPDVRPADYFTEAVDRMTRAGVMRGYEDRRFGPNDFVTRGQLAVVFDRYDQQMVEPLRQIILQMRAKLNLGRCGDNRVDTGEQCDDGNTTNNDGCSSSCFSEYGAMECGNGHRIGDSYPSSDGCNTCSCTVNGEICTLRACAPTERTCYGSQDCRTNEICSTELGDCRSNCPAGQYCPAVCSGVCVSKTTSSSSVSELSACRNERNEYESIIQYKSCTRDSDCALFSYSCPYVTCAEAINKLSLNDATRAAQDLASCRQEQGEPVACASCLRQTVACVNSQCVLRE